MNRNKGLLIVTVFLLYVYFIGGMVFDRKIMVEEFYLGNYEYQSSISCKSDSMGLTIDCKDTAFGNKVEKDDKLYPGYIYVYKSTNETDTRHIIHRLVYCLDEDCNQTVFKGDNNPVAEIVNRSDILYSVDVVMYR